MTVNLNVDSGVVWFERDGQVVCSEQSPDYFLSDLDRFGMRRADLNGYRALLNRQNAPLIACLAGSYVGGWVGRMAAHDLGTPAETLRALRDLTPLRLVQSHWQWLSVPYGGSYETAVLMSELADTGTTSPRALAALRAHPAWPALSFLPHLDRDAACRLLTYIGDPRWYYVHARQFNCLFRTLGVNESNLCAMVSGDRPPRGNYASFLALFRCWKPDQVGDLADPRNFLQRIRHSGEGTSAVLRACRRLAMFVALVWETSIATHPEVKFYESMFFKSPAECAAWRRHVEEISQVPR